MIDYENQISPIKELPELLVIALKLSSLTNAFSFVTQVLHEHPGATELDPDIALQGFKVLEWLGNEIEDIASVRLSDNIFDKWQEQRAELFRAAKGSASPC